MRNQPSIKNYCWRLLIVCAMLVALVVAPVSAMGSAGAPFTDFSQIDGYLETQMAALHLPGISLVIVQADQIVHARGLGIADPSGRLMTSQTPMLIGSVTKSFTALAILQLVEAGKIELDTPVQHYLPWFTVLPPPAAPGQVPDSQASSHITVRALLNQTSGLARATGERMMTGSDASGTALEERVRALANEHLARPAGVGFEYSNANYITLGMLIQAISGQSYEAYIQEHIFKPLEMDHSFASLLEARQDAMSAGYRQWFGFPVIANALPYPRDMLPAGYLISSAEDLGHYLIAQLNQGRYRDASILSPQGMQILHAAAVAAAPEGYHKLPSGSYAMGWYVMQMNDIPVLAHDGDTPNFLPANGASPCWSIPTRSSWEMACAIWRLVSSAY
jgi:CubicO group peptidase (beta-lactamase class C family)